MKTLPNEMAAFVLILFGSLTSGSAMAQHYGHGGWHYGYGGRVHYGFNFVVPFPGY